MKAVTEAALNKKNVVVTAGPGKLKSVVTVFLDDTRDLQHDCLATLVLSKWIFDKAFELVS